jgi:hypothetical protein
MHTPNSTTQAIDRLNDAPNYYAEKYPEVEPLGHFAQIEQRLRALALMVEAGGSDTVDKMLTLVNEEVQRRFPNGPMFQWGDLDSILKRDGGRKLTFSRKWKESNESVRMSLSVEVRIDEGGTTEVRVGRRLPER